MVAAGGGVPPQVDVHAGRIEFAQHSEWNGTFRVNHSIDVEGGLIPVNPQGGIERKEAPLHVSKVAIADPKTGKPTRVRFETRDGKKVRVAAKSGELING